MNNAKYDEIGAYYEQFVGLAVDAPFSLYRLTLNSLLRQLGDMKGKQLCDVACGEGYLSRLFALQGAEVVGVDISAVLLAQANKKTSSPLVRYVQDDAAQLVKLADNSFDVVVCNMALMDIENMAGLFEAAWRVLTENGRFLISLLHPCFETPFTVPHGQTEIDEQGNVIGCRVSRYGEEGLWHSGGSGIRGRVGAHHRKLSTILNGLISANFQLVHFVEPMLPAELQTKSPAEQWSQQVARSLIVECHKPCSRGVEP